MLLSKFKSKLKFFLELFYLNLIDWEKAVLFNEIFGMFNFLFHVFFYSELEGFLVYRPFSNRSIFPFYILSEGNGQTR